MELFWHGLHPPERWVGGCAAGTTVPPRGDRKRATQPTLSPPAGTPTLSPSYWQCGLPSYRNWYFLRIEDESPSSGTRHITHLFGPSPFRVAFRPALAGALRYWCRGSCSPGSRTPQLGAPASGTVVVSDHLLARRMFPCLRHGRGRGYI